LLVSGQTERRTSGNVCQSSSIPVVTYCCSTLLTVVLFIGFENAVRRERGRCSMCWRALVGGLCLRICLLSEPRFGPGASCILMILTIIIPDFSLKWRTSKLIIQSGTIVDCFCLMGYFNPYPANVENMVSS